MVRISPRSSATAQRNRTVYYTILALLVISVVVWHQTTLCNQTDTSLQSLFAATTTATKTKQQQQSSPNNAGMVATAATPTTYDSSQACLELPQIYASGVFFLNPQNIHQVKTIPEVNPSYFFGTIFSNANRVAYHMSDDIPYFDLIKESYDKSRQQHGGGKAREYLALDMGANQGFYTWYLASLGMQVHSFEIQHSNFDALQHGRIFNTKEVADRAHLYPMGLSSSIGRVGQSKGGSYEAHIQKSDDGTILTVTLDCWAQHVQPQPLPVEFVKLDVEGFEIAVLQGAKQSLLKQKGQVVTWFMEVAPDRWSRANIALEVGTAEMTRLQTDLFDRTYLLVRGDKDCPYDIATKNLANAKQPRLLTRNVQVHAITTPQEMKAILSAMNEQHSSCNFWFTNQTP
ncbi:hypothetical protein ACA910_010933 [Epithemia clementina (nom. ined.)]